jgi:hypothetical protein
MQFTIGGNNGSRACVLCLRDWDLNDKDDFVDYYFVHDCYPSNPLEELLEEA